MLDEPDDFDMADLPALARLVHWAGLFGTRVVLSSATLPPALVQGLFLAYQAGREEFQRHRGRPGARLDICCGWFDEFGAESHSHGTDPDGAAFLASHAAFVDRRIVRLTSVKQVRRRAAILPVPVKPSSANDRARQQADICRQLADLLRDQAVALHRHHHSSDPITGKRVSFGLIRMANIDPLFDVALSLYALGAPEGCRIHLCVYHARHPTLVRAEIEKQLDAVLKRNRPDAVVFAQPDLREKLDTHPETDHIFIVLATAVAEVGRDHCYDWAIVEPSSMRSIIQLAGRVKRHREFDCLPDQPNILLLDVNVKSLKHGEDAPAFCWPGFESREKGTKFHLRTYRLSQLLTPEQWQVINARARIRPREPLDGKGNLADLEHVRLADLMLGAEAGQKQQDIPAACYRPRRRSGPTRRATKPITSNRMKTARRPSFSCSKQPVRKFRSKPICYSASICQPVPALPSGALPITSMPCKRSPRPCAKTTLSTAPAGSARSICPVAKPTSGGAITRRLGSAARKKAEITTTSAFICLSGSHILPNKQVNLAIF